VTRDATFWQRAEQRVAYPRALAYAIATTAAALLATIIEALH
jgi:hypothetical protein